MKLVEDARNWSSWWSVRLSIVGGFVLTLLEVFPDVLSAILVSLPSEVRAALDPEHLKFIGICCVFASPVARVIRQNKLDVPAYTTAKKRRG